MIPCCCWVCLWGKNLTTHLNLNDIFCVFWISEIVHGSVLSCLCLSVYLSIGSPKRCKWKKNRWGKVLFPAANLLTCWQGTLGRHRVQYHFSFNFRYDGIQHLRVLLCEWFLSGVVLSSTQKRRKNQCQSHSRSCMSLNDQIADRSRHLRLLWPSGRGNVHQVASAWSFLPILPQPQRFWLPCECRDSSSVPLLGSVQKGQFSFFFFFFCFQDQDPGSPYFSDNLRRLVREALSTRYTLLPYLYTLLHQSHTSGSTVVRPLLHEYVFSMSFSVLSHFLWVPTDFHLSQKSPIFSTWTQVASLIFQIFERRHNVGDWQTIYVGSRVVDITSFRKGRLHNWRNSVRLTEFFQLLCCQNWRAD